MKYIITENQFNNIYFKYLDWKFEDLVENSEIYENARVWVKGDIIILFYREDNNTLRINPVIREDFQRFFKLNFKETKEIFEKYIDSRFYFRNVTIII